MCVFIYLLVLEIGPWNSYMLSMYFTTKYPSPPIRYILNRRIKDVGGRETP